MLAIRLQRRGRSGHAQYRLVVQDSRFSPTSGRVVAYVGSYDPHTKVTKIDAEKIEGYLQNGAQPSGRAIKLLEANKVKLPSWVKKSADKKREVRKPEKRRSTALEAPATEAPETAPEASIEAESAKTPAEVASEALSTEDSTTEVEEVAEEAAMEGPAEPAQKAEESKGEEAG